MYDHKKKYIRRGGHDRATLQTSSSKAELYAAVRATCEALGHQMLLRDLGIDTGARVHVDASAAKSIIEREGLAKVRHIDVNGL